MRNRYLAFRTKRPEKRKRRGKGEARTKSSTLYWLVTLIPRLRQKTVQHSFINSVYCSQHWFTLSTCRDPPLLFPVKTEHSIGLPEHFPQRELGGANGRKTRGLCQSSRIYCLIFDHYVKAVYIPYVDWPQALLPAVLYFLLHHLLQPWFYLNQS